MAIPAPQLVIARACGAFTRATGRGYRLRRKLATVGVGLVAVFLAFHIVFGANGIMVYQKKRVEYRNLQKDLEQLQKENQALAGQIRALKTDPHAIEREAREQLRYARPGEVIYLMPQPKPVLPPPNSAAQNR